MRNTSDDFNKKKYLVLYGVAIIMADIEILIKKYNKTPTGKMTRKRPDLNWCQTRRHTKEALKEQDEQRVRKKERAYHNLQHQSAKSVIFECAFNTN